MNKIISLICIIAVLFSFAACDAEKPTENSAEEYKMSTEGFKTEAVKGEEVAADTYITLDNSSTKINGSGADANGSQVTIKNAGSYAISGQLDDGQIIIDTDDDEKVELILNGAYLHCDDDAAIFVKNAPKKAVINSAKGSVNIISDGEQYSDTSEDAPSAAIYSKDDLDIGGEGEIYVVGNYNKGIFGKDDLDIEGGTLYVASIDDGIRGKDSLDIKDGYIYVEAGADGLRTSNETEADKGNIQISGGEIHITAGQDAIQAITDLTITDGIIDIFCGGGSENSSSENSDNWGNWGGEPPEKGMGKGHKGDAHMPPEQNGKNADMIMDFSSMAATSEDSTSTSAKAIKCGGTLKISSGNISIDSSDDAVHSNDSMEISGGTINIASGDDGLHADNSLVITGGDIVISKSYEGVEAQSITVSGGNIDVTSSDDGFNSAGGNDGSAMGRPGANTFTSNSNSFIELNGGYVAINASGDGIDSNGNINMTGGTVIVYGPTNSANGALDYAGKFEISGGTLLACGSIGMAQSVEGTTQGVLAFRFDKISQNTIMCIEHSSEELIVFQSPKEYECVIFSSSGIRSGETYKIYVEGLCSGEQKNGVYTGEYSNGELLGSISAN